ncbi:MAG: hypothetical protein NTW11_03230 [Candidatus Staskawiczbacteria bacterium]|nr:hypothetical protein [Candidatus Staskawiczbacteria bacterium]
MDRKVKIVITCLVVGVVAGLSAHLFFKHTTSAIIGVAAGAWIVLVANDWCLGVWALRRLGVLPPKK